MSLNAIPMKKFALRSLLTYLATFDLQYSDWLERNYLQLHFTDSDDLSSKLKKSDFINNIVSSEF